MSRATTPDETSLIGGLDVLRIGGALLVTAFHALVLTGHDKWSTFHSLQMGQVGVALFLGISALLGSTSRRRAVPWLVQRLRRLFPPYWIVMIASFLVARVTGYKKFTLGQIVSQMLGFGFLTHPGTLVNVATWFITVVLVCYICLFFARLVNRPLLIPLLLLIFCIVSYVGWTDRVWTYGRGWAWGRCIIFFASSVLATACPASRRRHGFLAAGIVVLLGAPFSIACAYTGISLVMIGAALGIPKVSPLIHMVAGYTYEYYLVHGICLIATTRMLRGHPAIAVASGVLLAALASVLLQKVARFPWAVTIRNFATLSWSSRQRTPGPPAVSSSSGQ